MKKAFWLAGVWLWRWRSPRRRLTHQIGFVSTFSGRPP